MSFRLFTIRALLVAICAYFSLSHPVHATGYRTNHSIKSADKCRLRVVWGIWPPYQYFAADGSVTGLQIELIDDILDQVNCSAEYIQQPFHQNVASIRDGRADMMADITPTAERAKFALFSVPYRKENMVLYVDRSNHHRCKDSDIGRLIRSGFRLGVTRGNWYGEEIEAFRKSPELSASFVYLNENEQGTDQLLAGKIDGFFEDPTVMAYKLRQRGLREKLLSCRIIVAGASVSFMFSKKTVSPALVKQINEAIETIKQTPTYKKRWQW